jgi:hypothetical protein
MAHAADASIVVSIMSREGRKSTVNVPLIGGEAALPGFAVVAFPSGSFEQARKVMVSAAASDSDIFGAHETGLRLPYEIRINTGDSAPEKDMRVDLNLPDSFYASPFQIHIFARMQDNPAATDDHGRFVMLTSSVKSATMTASTVFPRQAFSTRFSKDGTFEAVLTVGLIPF